MTGRQGDLRAAVVQDAGSGRVLMLAWMDDEALRLTRETGEAHFFSRSRQALWHKGATRNVSATIAEWPEERVAVAGERGPRAGKLGLAVRPLSEAERRDLGVEGGVMVEAAEGAAAAAGMRPGDVILAVNGENVKSVEDLRRLTAKAKGNVAVLVKREDSRIYLPIRVG